MTHEMGGDDRDAKGSPAASPRAGRASLLIGLCCFLVYNANLRSISAGDTYPARYLPFAIVQHHTLFLDPIARVAAQGRGDGAYWLLRRPDGHRLSLYPVVGSLLVAPLYIPAVAYLNQQGWTDARLDYVAKVMEKITASLLAALSASLLYLVVRRRANARAALLLTVAYAFGTTTWMISSQALWQHGMAELLVVAALLVLTGPCTRPRTLAAGLLLGLIAGNRPPDVVLAAALGAGGLIWAGRRRAVLLIAAAALPLLFVVVYNLRAVGILGGGYGLISIAGFFQDDLLVGFSGLLVSPTRGLLVFSPFFLFLGLAWRRFPRDRQERWMTVAMGVAVVLQIVLYGKTDWRSGLAFGPRYMTDLLPFLIWMLVPVVVALRGFARAVFTVTVAVAVAIEGLGAFAYTDSLDLPIYAADNGAVHDMRGAWDWRNTPIVTSLRHGLAPAELTTQIRGSFDVIETDGGATSVLTAGERAFAAGWALAGDATPWQVAVTIDGRQAFWTTVFFDRPDVRAALHVSSASGWRIPIDTTGLAAGEHHVTAFAWVHYQGESRYLAERTLVVRSALTGAS